MSATPGTCIKPGLVWRPLCPKVNLPSCVARRPLCHKVNLPSCVARRPLCHKVNLPSCVARRPLCHKVRARSIQPKFPEISVQNSMDRFSPTGKVSKKQVHLLRWSSFPGRTGLNLGWMDRALNLPSCVARRPLCHKVNLPSCVARQLANRCVTK